MAPPVRSRLVRKESLMTRLKNYFDPLDFLLWASEELNSTDLEDVLKQWSIPAGVLLNFVFMVARANTGGPGVNRGDDVFGDYHARRGSGWLVWFVSSRSSTRHRKYTKTCVGHLHRSLLDHPLCTQRNLHIHAQTALPPLRSQRRCCTQHTVRTSCQCRLLTLVTIPSTLPFACPHFQQCRSTSTP